MKVPLIDIAPHELYNLYYIGFEDISEYPSSWTISNPTIEITPPGFPKVSHTATAKGVNVFKSSQLGLTCADDDCVILPDGVYKVKFSVYPNSTYFIEKQFMRVNAIRCQYGDAFLKVDFAVNCDHGQKAKDKRTLHSIKMLIEGSVAEVNNCDVDAAYKYYNKAKAMLDNFNKSCNCK